VDYSLAGTTAAKIFNAMAALGIIAFTFGASVQMYVLGWACWDSTKHVAAVVAGLGGKLQQVLTGGIDHSSLKLMDDDVCCR
jgi:hypothetical protein